MEHKDVIKTECELNGCNFSNIDADYTNFFDIVYRIISAKKHEKHTPEFGVIFCKDKKIFSGKTIDKVFDKSCDAKQVFQIYYKDESGKNRQQMFVFDKEQSYSDLISYCKGTGTVIIIRTTEDIFVFYNGKITRIDGWSFYCLDSPSYIRNEIQKYNDTMDIDSFMEILNFAFYELSMNKIGTTIVCLSEKKGDEKSFVSKDECSLDFSKEEERRILFNYLKNNDGAIVINSELKVIYQQVFLKYEKDENIKQYSGTRHQSSACYSKAHKGVLIVTVSEDGPVTVFYDGAEVHSFYPLDFFSQTENENSARVIKDNHISNDANLLLDESSNSRNSMVLHTPQKTKAFKDFSGLICMAEEQGEIANEYEDSVDCPNCKTHYRVHYLKITGWNDREKLYCRKCGEKYYQRSCFELEGHEE